VRQVVTEVVSVKKSFAEKLKKRIKKNILKKKIMKRKIMGV